MPAFHQTCSMQAVRHRQKGKLRNTSARQLLRLDTYIDSKKTTLFMDANVDMATNIQAP